MQIRATFPATLDSVTAAKFAVRVTQAINDHLKREMKLDIKVSPDWTLWVLELCLNEQPIPPNTHIIRGAPRS